jgi:glycosyltransferase involved in cell wall biosynthesis
MRHGAVTFSNMASAHYALGSRWDLIFCTSMLNVAEFKGLVPSEIADLPTVVYFHENQLTYPVRHLDERDLHFGLINFSTCLAAQVSWFNSRYHLDTFMQALTETLSKMPDHDCRQYLPSIASKAMVQPLGIDPPPEIERKVHYTPTILWAARWEYDKNPGLFFDALRALRDKGLPFKINVIGESFTECPPEFDSAKEEFEDRIIRWGWQKHRNDYWKALSESDIVVSTANHEFFGISVVEAIAAGVYPLLPRRLAYPEILAGMTDSSFNEYLYDGSVEDLTYKLGELIEQSRQQELWHGDAGLLSKSCEKYHWPVRAPVLDDALENIERTVTSASG